MEYSTRAKMPMSQRAKQFMPFAAVKGLEEALAKQETLLKQTERPELGEEKSDAINATLLRIAKGMRVSVTYYDINQCKTLQGTVTQLNSSLGWLKIKDSTILLSDIISISIHRPPEIR